MSKFFINRPIVAVVISILTVIIGAVTIAALPVAQFPNIVPPEVAVLATYVGADAQTIEQSVATPIEQQMSGADNMNYMYSLNSTADGLMHLIVDYDVKTDPNTDLMLTQMRETQGASQLPTDVTNYGISVQKTVTAPLMLITLYSPKGTYDARFLANYAYINLADQINRSYGIGSVQVFGAGQYAMRLWVKPDQLAKLAITVPEIVSAIQSQNSVNPAGQVGSEPVPKGQQFTYSVRAQGRMTSPEEFENIVVRESLSGAVVRVKDVARVELGAQTYSVVSRLDRKDAAIVAVYQVPGSNAVQAANDLKKLMAELKARLPQDVDYAVSLDTTQAVSEGMKEIVLTLIIAIALVLVVVFVFLQGWRATLIPLVAVPVSLVGTFMFFPLFGFSINTLSLFGLVLAIGLVVDDAIVVVEAVERHIEEGLAPKAAAFKAMEEISGPVIGIALVLAAVFVPTAFIPGITGRLYQQFAVTIAVSVLLSAFNALTLSPALAALLLRPKTSAGGPLRAFFAWFNHAFANVTEWYVRLCGFLVRKAAIALILLAAFAVGAGWFGSKVPSSFLPDEDQGYVLINLQLPTAASLQRTDDVAAKIESALANTPGVEHTTSIVGFSLLSLVRTTYNAFFFVTLKPWDQRKSRSEQVQAIKEHINEELSSLPEGVAFSFSPPAIPGIGNSGGFTFVLEDRAGRDPEFLSSNLNTFLTEARKRPELTGVSTTSLASVPQLYANVDREKVIKQGVPVKAV
jgi:HAE1 family hydrophobic/amphiphilic exporter-1